MQGPDPARRPPTVLIVEDSDEDYTIIRRALGHERTINIVRCAAGDQALSYLRAARATPAETSVVPTLVLLDLNLPGLDGREVLAAIKADTALRGVPVVIMTTSANPRDVEFCYQHGAAGYMVKVLDWARLTAGLRQLCTYWFDTVTLPAEHRL